MPRPIKHKEMLRRLRALGWDGPFQKGKHPFMVKAELRLTIPNPHQGDIDWSLMKRILQVAEFHPVNGKIFEGGKFREHPQSQCVCVH